MGVACACCSQKPLTLTAFFWWSEAIHFPHLPAPWTNCLLPGWTVFVVCDHLFKGRGGLKTILLFMRLLFVLSPPPPPPGLGRALA